MGVSSQMFGKVAIVMKNGLELKPEVIETIREMSNAQVEIIHYNEMKKSDLDSDLVITIGGDGTFVRASNLIQNSLILGINAEPHKSEGALTSIDLCALEKLREVFSGRYEVKKLQRAMVALNGKVLDEHALNEVYIGAINQFHSSRYKIRFRGQEEEHRSSGVLVSTGTGSRAWFYSAGGKAFEPHEERLGFIVREPYFGKRLFKPKLISGFIDKGEKIIIEPKRDFGGVLAINDSTYDFNNGDVAEIQLSNKPLEVIVVK